MSTPNTVAQEQWLNNRLTELRESTETLATPAELHANLMQAFAAHHAKKRRGERFAQWFAPSFALAASAGMSAWMVLAPIAVPVLDSDTNVAYAVAGAGTPSDVPFIALQSLEQIALEPQPRLIETAVPRMWLASYGVAVAPEGAGDSMRAEMLVSANGQPLAMRFLP